MIIKILGAILVVTGSGCFAFMLTAAHKKEARYLKEYIRALELMECELQYRLTPLPDLCNITANFCTGGLKKLFSALAKELENQISPDVERCMSAALDTVGDIPKLTKSAVQQLGPILGRFDLDGQCRGLESLRMDAIRTIKTYSENQDTRLRNYQTLGICAGAAIVILFI